MFGSYVKKALLNFSSVDLFWVIFGTARAILFRFLLANCANAIRSKLGKLCLRLDSPRGVTRGSFCKGTTTTNKYYLFLIQVRCKVAGTYQLQQNLPNTDIFSCQTASHLQHALYGNSQCLHQERTDLD